MSGSFSGALISGSLISGSPISGAGLTRFTSPYTLDFLASTAVIPAPLTFSRTSGATRFDAREYLEEVGSNVSRFVYDPALTYNELPDPWGAPGPIAGGLTITWSVVGADADGWPIWEGVVSGTTNGNSQTSFWPSPAFPIQIPTTPSDGVWSTGLNIEVLAASGCDVRHWLSSANSSGVTINTGSWFSAPIVPGTPAQRYLQTNRALTNVNTAGVITGIRLDGMTAGTAVSARIRVSAPVLSHTAAQLTDTVPLATLGARINGVPQYGLRGLLLEGSRTSYSVVARNAGVVAGTPGTPPPGNSFVSPDGSLGLTRTVVGSGTEGGIPYWDIRWSGTATSGGNLLIALGAYANSGFAAAQPWTGSAYLRLVAGSWAGTTSPTHIVSYYLTGLVFEGASSETFTPTSAPLKDQRNEITYTTVSGSGQELRHVFSVTVTNGAAVDFTLRIGAPQLEVGAFTSSPILPPVGSPAVTTRAPDVLTSPWSKVAPTGSATILISAVVPNANLGNRTLFSASNGTDNNRWALRIDTGVLKAFKVVNGSVTISSNIATLSGEAIVTAGLTITAGRIAAYANGGVLSEVLGVLPAVTTFQVGGHNGQFDPLFGDVIAVKVLPRAVSDAELQTLVAALPRPWTPAELGSSLALWLDASDASTITLNGSNVSQWNDKSGNGRNVSQATAANQPAYLTSGLNSRPAIDFTSDVLRGTVSGTVASDWTIMAALDIDTNPALSYVFDAQTGRIITNATGPAIYNGTGFVPATTNNQTGPQTLGWIAQSPSAAAIYRNGTALSSGLSFPTQLAVNGAIGIGGHSSALSNFYDGKIGELIVTSDITTANRQKLEGYMAWKWNLVGSLPAGHPYKSAPPIV